jgi:hypothetical protein
MDADSLEEIDPSERGPLAQAFWGVLEKRLEDPRLQEAAEKEGFGAQLASETQKICADVASSMVETLLERAPGMLVEHRAVRTRFEGTTEEVWGEALDLLQMFLVICTEAGDDVNRRQWDPAFRADDHTFHALIRLHARACLVSSEVLTLLRAGYPSGAHARWRTLHELAVVSYFIREHGNEIADRYLRHDVIQAYKASLMHRRHAAALAEEPLSDEEFDALKAERDKLVVEFGREFLTDYGWAASALPGTGAKFAEIEMAVDLDHFRPYYKMASNAVHPNAGGSFFDLGLAEDEHILLAGPSTRGFADPGAGACLSLLQTSVCLLGHRLDVDELVVMLILQQLGPKVQDAFFAAHQAHDAEADRRAGGATGE